MAAVAAAAGKREAVESVEMRALGALRGRAATPDPRGPAGNPGAADSVEMRALRGRVASPLRGRGAREESLLVGPEVLLALVVKLARAARPEPVEPRRSRVVPWNAATVAGTLRRKNAMTATTRAGIRAIRSVG